jgi:hypothetical protein
MERSLLLSLLSLEDRPAIARLALLDVDAIVILLKISSDSLKTLARALSSDDLQWLARYLPKLEQPQVNQLVALLSDQPALMAKLKDEGVLAQIAGSRDVEAALAFLTAPGDALTVLDDLARLATGAVSLRLFAYKYGIAATTLLVALPVLLLLSLAYSLLAWILSPVMGLIRLLTRSWRGSAQS